MAKVSTGAASTVGPVLIVGTGLIGTSIALALRERDVEVWLSDPSPVTLALASDMGAGTPIGPDISSAQAEEPTLVVVAAPPDLVGGLVVESLLRFSTSIVTDVASVKQTVVSDVVELIQDESVLARFVGSHPMAGRERSGASSAHGDLFYGRPWVIVPMASSSPEAIRTVRNLAVDVGATPLELDAGEHDQAVAMVSHVPQLVSSLLAARLTDASGEALSLAGQGLRDTTRIASSDPRLWTAIIAGNSKPVAGILSALQEDLAELVDRLGDEERVPGLSIAAGAAGVVSRVITEGNKGVSRIPGKHGGAPSRWSEIEVLVPDRPGALGRLFTELGAVGVSIEDLNLEHAGGRPVGIARIMVAPDKAEEAVGHLEELGWSVAHRESQ